MSCFCDTKKNVSNLNNPISSVSSCSFSLIDPCEEKTIFYEETQPFPLQQGITYLNSIASNSDDFIPVKCGNSIGYSSTDPRLIDQVRGIFLTLDRPPDDTGISLSDIYKPNNIKQHYSGYDDIKFGQIKYYTQKDLDGAYFGPNFANEREVTGYLFKNPMDEVSPKYQRDPGYRCPFERGNNYEHCYSFMEDTTNQREDIMANIINSIDRGRYQSRWTNI